jgi:hypothetical protein
LAYGDPVPGAKAADYRVGAVSTRAYHNKACYPFTEVYHYSHVDSALEIVQDGRLRGQLVADKGLFSTHRAPVVWLSPADYEASIYGQVRFTFALNPTPTPGHTFWVEAIEYSKPTPRLLISDPAKIPPALAATLKAYDPLLRDGPWHIDSTARHWWNSKQPLHFMYMSDIPLDKCKGVSFVDHRATYCARDRYACPDVSVKSDDASAEFVSGLVVRGLKKLNHAFRDPPASRNPSNSLFNAVKYEVTGQVRKQKTFSGSVKSVDASSSALARGILAAIAARRPADVTALAALFATKDDGVTATRRVVAEHFEVEDAKLA